MFSTYAQCRISNIKAVVAAAAGEKSNVNKFVITLALIVVCLFLSLARSLTLRGHMAWRRLHTIPCSVSSLRQLNDMVCASGRIQPFHIDKGKFSALRRHYRLGILHTYVIRAKNETPIWRSNLLRSLSGPHKAVNYLRSRMENLICSRRKIVQAFVFM
jgi:hypothetical protein